MKLLIGTTQWALVKSTGQTTSVRMTSNWLLWETKFSVSAFRLLS